MTAIQTFIPFTFGLKVNNDGTCSTPLDTDVVFPYVKNRKLWNEDYPHIAHFPEAIALIHDLHPNDILTREETNRLLVFHGFPKMNQGNWTHAVDQGLITRLSIRRFSRKHPKGVSLFASNSTGKKLNLLAKREIRWALSSKYSHKGLMTPEDKFQWIKDFANTLSQRGHDHFLNDEH